MYHTSSLKILVELSTKYYYNQFAIDVKKQIYRGIQRHLLFDLSEAFSKSSKILIASSLEIPIVFCK